MSIAQETLIYQFGDFVLDVPNRQLWRANERMDLNARYFDALVLLVQEHGRLVEKDRFFDVVWDDVVVGDSALTQCIKDIRRQLDDDATNPRYIQTVPRHGYRFIADVSILAESDLPARSGSRSPEPAPPRSAETVAEPERVPVALRDSGSAFSAAMATTLAATVGGAVAGLLGGLLYGFGLAYSSVEQDLGAASLLLVLISLSALLGTVGAFGIGAGMAAADHASNGRPAWRIVGAMLGGMLIGGSVKLLGVDAFSLLFGHAPAGITGGLEGAALGLAVGLGAHAGGSVSSTAWWRPILAAAMVGAVAGVSIALSGGHLLGGSLDLLAESFVDSRLRLDAIGRYFGEVRFGRTSQVVLAGIEGTLYAACVVGALAASRQTRSSAAVARAK